MIECILKSIIVSPLYLALLLVAIYRYMLMYNFFLHNNKQNQRQRKISVLNIFLRPEKSPRTGSLINIVETIMFAVVDNIKLE